MKVSIDLDGTLWQHMAFFRALMVGLQTQGHQVGILTGHGVEIRDNDIALMVARGFPRPDFYFGKETEEDKGRNGSHFKLRTIMEQDIDLHYDDADFDNPESHRILIEGLNGQGHRYCRVHHRMPHNEHFE